MQKSAGEQEWKDFREKYALKWLAGSLHYLEETGSTNEDARACSDRGEPSGTVVVADRQNAGRGRRGREWISPAGENLYFTLLLRPELEPQKASMLTLVMAVAVAEAMHNVGVRAGIKWPNDIVADGKKLCGILTEMRLMSPAAACENGMKGNVPAIRDVIIGVGVNVNQQEFAPELEGRASSLKLILGKECCRKELLMEILLRFEENYAVFLRDGDLGGLRPLYEELLVNRGRQVRVEDPKEAFTGMARGITDTGELVVEREDGSLTEVYAGEVSVRGIYGYV